MTNEYLDQLINDLEEKIDSLRPVVEEHRTLVKARESLLDLKGDPSENGEREQPQDESELPVKLRTPPSSQDKPHRGGNPSGSGKWDVRVLEYLSTNPGDRTVAEIAKGVGLDPPNYMYRVIPRLLKKNAIYSPSKGVYRKR